MNILYSGDGNIADGLILSTLSLAKNVSEPLNIYILTASFEYKGKKYIGLDVDLKDKISIEETLLGEESCNSDHCHFVQRGVPAHFLFTYGCEYNEYHTIYDNGKDLPFTKHIDFCNLLKEFVRRY